MNDSSAAWSAVTKGVTRLNFYKSRSDLAREWSERSRQRISGAWPQLALGSSVQDRNTVVERDLSSLRRRIQ